MTTEKSQPPIASAPVVTSCRRKKSEDATFLQDVKDHINEFTNASMDEHKTCFQKTISKVMLYVYGSTGKVNKLAQKQRVKRQPKCLECLRSLHREVLMIRELRVHYPYKQLYLISILPYGCGMLFNLMILSNVLFNDNA